MKLSLELQQEPPELSDLQRLFEAAMIVIVADEAVRDACRLSEYNTARARLFRAQKQLGEAISAVKAGGLCN